MAYALDIRYTTDVTFTSHSGYSRHFDFVISKSKKSSERIIKAINNPNISSVDSLVLDWLDTKDSRPDNSKAYAILNDIYQSVPSSAIEAPTNYDINANL